MAHKIIAADLGASTIKLARFDASYRKVALLDVRTIAISQADAKPEDRIIAQLAVVAQTIASDKFEAEEVVVGLPGDVLAFRIVDLPFANTRQIEQTLGYELEALILTPVEELVLDFVVVGPARQAGGATTPETRVLAACAPRALIERLVKAAQELQLPLRVVSAAPLSYAGLFAAAKVVVEKEKDKKAGKNDKAEETAEAAPELEAPREGVVLVVDVGADTTTVCALRDGRPEMARTISRGGRGVTDTIAAAFKLDPDRAEQAKIEAGFVAHSQTPRMTQAQAHMDAAVREALGPLVRELRQTLAAYRAAYGEEPEKIYIAGGGARLSGLPEHFAEELGLPVAPLPFPERADWQSGPSIFDRRDVLGVAVGLGAGTVAPGLQVNFRKGEFAYRSDYSFLRDKAPYFAVATALVLGFAGVDAWVSYRGLEKEHGTLTAKLNAASKEVFGKERDDASQISDEMKQGPRAVAQVPLPTATAFDVLDEISRMAPPSDKIRLDITDLEIRPKKLLIKGTAETAQQVDDLADALKKIDCFDEVQKGKLATITLPQPYIPPDQLDKQKEKDKRPTELKTFSMNIKSSCL